MADLGEMIRWNAGFVRGLAQSVLDRAQKIRSSLAPYVTEADTSVEAAGKKPKPRVARKPAKKRVKRSDA